MHQPADMKKSIDRVSQRMHGPDVSGGSVVAAGREIETGHAAGELLHLLADRPGLILRFEAKLVMRLTLILWGRETPGPTSHDPRFVHPAWRSSPLYGRIAAFYRALTETLRDVVEAADLPAAHRRRLSAAVEQVIAAASPANLFLTHPGFYENLVASRGRSALRGLYQLLRDLRDTPGLPRQVDASAFAIGTDIAATPGAVIHRDPLFELIQYAPQTARVDASPILLVGPQINKYYIFDLTRDNSLVRHALAGGQQVFAVSWRNPTAAQCGWGLADYVDAVMQAIAIVWRIAGRRSIKLAGAGPGGLTAAVAAACCATRGQGGRIACLSLFGAPLESPRHLADAPAGSGEALIRALSGPAESGALDGAAMARTFAWQRPDALIWPFVTRNYVLGESPPASDFLYWRADTTRIPARLRDDLLAVYRDNQRLDAYGADPGAVDQDVFVVAGETDHIAPWQACYRSLQMFRGRRRFVLGAGDHACTLLCPPCAAENDAGRQFWINDDHEIDPADWRRGARAAGASWWPAWLAWCRAHGGPEIAAPEVYGDAESEPIAAAPGRYVRQR